VNGHPPRKEHLGKKRKSRRMIGSPQRYQGTMKERGGTGFQGGVVCRTRVEINFGENER